MLYIDRSDQRTIRDSHREPAVIVRQIAFQVRYLADFMGEALKNIFVTGQNFFVSQRF